MTDQSFSLPPIQKGLAVDALPPLEFGSDNLLDHDVLMFCTSCKTMKANRQRFDCLTSVFICTDCPQEKDGGQRSEKKQTRVSTFRLHSRSPNPKRSCVIKKHQIMEVIPDSRLQLIYIVKDCFLHILSFLDVQSLLRTCQTCKYALLQGSSNQLWKPLYDCEFTTTIFGIGDTALDTLAEDSEIRDVVYAVQQDPKNVDNPGYFYRAYREGVTWRKHARMTQRLADMKENKKQIITKHHDTRYTDPQSSLWLLDRADREITQAASNVCKYRGLKFAAEDQGNIKIPQLISAIPKLLEAARKGFHTGRRLVKLMTPSERKEFSVLQV